MWPFSSSGALDQAIGQAIPPQQLSFGSLSMPQQSAPPSASANANAGQPGGLNRILSNPQLMQALGRMGSSISAANNSGAGFGGSLAAGFGGFNQAIEQQATTAMQNRRAEAEIALAEAKAREGERAAQYGVQSGGFEGDIARAVVVLRDPNSTDQDKAVAQGVIDTAQRLQGSYDPVTGDYRWNQRARVESAEGGTTRQGLPQNPAAMPAPVSEHPTDGMLLPPTASAGTPGDASMFSVPATGNRKVDAALQQKALEGQIERQQKSQTELPKVTSQGKYMLSVIDQALNSPGLEESVGGPAGLTGRLAQTFPITQGQRDFAPIAEQLRGNTFLTAYQELKGGGAITEVEGQKAEAAIARLQQYQSGPAYRAALEELKTVVQGAMGRAENAAAGNYRSAAGPAPSAPSVKRLRYNPQTGALE